MERVREREGCLMEPIKRAKAAQTTIQAQQGRRRAKRKRGLNYESYKSIENI